MASDILAEQLRLLWRADTDQFSILVQQAGLDKETAFVGADFSGMDLSDDILQGFNFEGADFREANIAGTEFIGCNLSEALFSAAPNIPEDQDYRVVEPGGDGKQIAELMAKAEKASRQDERLDALRSLAPYSQRPDVTAFLRQRAIRDKGKYPRDFAAEVIAAIEPERNSLKEIAFARVLRGTFRYGADVHFQKEYLERYRGDTDFPQRLIMVAARGVLSKHFLSLMDQFLQPTEAPLDAILAIAHGCGSPHSQASAVRWLIRHFPGDPRVRAMLERLTEMPVIEAVLMRTVMLGITSDGELARRNARWIRERLAQAKTRRADRPWASALRAVHPTLLKEQDLRDTFVEAAGHDEDEDARRAAFKKLLEFCLGTSSEDEEDFYSRPYWYDLELGFDPREELSEDAIEALTRTYGVEVVEALSSVSSMGVALRLPA